MNMFFDNEWLEKQNASSLVQLMQDHTNTSLTTNSTSL